MPPRLKIADVQKFMAAKGGKCLSTMYKNQNELLSLECSKKHRWEASFKALKFGGNWCQQCQKQEYLDKAHQRAKERNGACLSQDYVDAKSQLRWKCSNENHPAWDASFDSVMRIGSWCPYCSGNARLTIDVAKKVAIERGGICLSTMYVNNSSYLTWQCGRGHIWRASLNSVKDGKKSWCPSCSMSHLEMACQKIVERLLGPCQVSAWPGFLRSDKNHRMELDIYYPELGFAIECQGDQHKKFVPHFHGDEDGFRKQLERDELKRALCDRNWIVLLEVWEEDEPAQVITNFLRDNVFI
jgi:hypothetical protein